MLTSFFAQMFVELQDRILSKVPEIKWVDQDFAQLDVYEGERPPVLFPCVLIDFNETSYTQDGQQVETGDTSINFKLAFAPFSASNSGTPAAYKEKALAYYELENKLYLALKGWAPDSGICQPLNRTGAASEKGREDVLRVRNLTFSTSFEDDGAMPPITHEPADLTIEYLASLLS